jgi:hypothetical protein
VPRSIQQRRLAIDRLLIVVPPALPTRRLAGDERVLFVKEAVLVAPGIRPGPVFERAHEDQAASGIELFRPTVNEPVLERLRVADGAVAVVDAITGADVIAESLGNAGGAVRFP